VDPVLSRRARHRARTTALVAALSLVVAPLVVAPAANAVDRAPVTQVADATDATTAELTDVVAPAPEQLALTGTARVGEQVGVDPRADLWAPAGVELTFTYRWFADDAELADATADTLVVPVEAAGRVLSVEVTGTAPDGVVDGAPTATVVVSAADAVVAGAFVTGDLQVTGDARVGRTLTAVAGAWTPDVVPTIEWRRGDVVLGAGTTYVPVAADAGSALTVVATATAAGYEPASTSVTTEILPGALAGPVPTISGTVRVGSTVTARPGTWTSGTTFTYRWYASGTSITGATRPTYTPTASVKGKTLRVRVWGAKTGYATTYRTSAATKVAAGVLSAPRPKITGTVRVGARVAVSKGTWKPAASTYRYQWRVNGAKISGATKSSYVVPSRYAGKNLTVTVTGSRSGYATKAVTSSSSRVLRVYSRTSAPTISGTVRVGSTVKVASRGTWTPKPSSWRYQWRADGAAIKGATRSSFTLTKAQHGKRISVTIKGVRSGYYGSSRTSARTAEVRWPVGVSKPRVTAQPQGVYVKTGTPVRFSAKASGGRLHYQWQKRTAESGRWENMSGRTYSSTGFTARSSHTLMEVRLRVSNVAGTTSSKAATLFVDSSRTDPYAAGKWYLGNLWLQTLWDTEAYADRSIDAWFVGCRTADDAASISADLDIAYVGSDGRTYRDVVTHPYAVDGDCEQVAVEVRGIGLAAATGGVWKIVDRSRDWQYGATTQWVRGLR